MKRQYVQSLQDGDTVNDYFIAVRKDVREQQKGGKFLGMVFKDRTGEIGGIQWTNALAAAKLFELGDVVNVRGTVTSYQDRLQIRVDQVLPLRAEEYNLDDLVYKPENTEEVSQTFRGIMDTVKNEWLRKLVFAFLDDEEFMKRFSAAAAGKKWHHAYRGGLLQHCTELARLAAAVSEIFPRLDRDVLLTGVLVHDIGKLEEMSQDMFVDYTTAGKLLGHLAIGAEMVQQRIATIPDFPESLRLQVLHCVWSHHGEMVNGSPVVPKTVEALVLYHIDNLDAQTDAFFRIIDETREKGQTWSDYIQMIERQVWTKERM
ncbi:MAG TPA: HD domain-containing protein [Candidatus Hydrogenedentes bacterium]|nr:HD domain-containing protein [Candidatus Hydrogenedentota bacterium]